MKKIFICGIMCGMFCTLSIQGVKAQVPIVEIIKAAVKKVIVALDLKTQRKQNKIIWLQNAQKTLENQMSKLKLGEISDWASRQKELYANYFEELRKVKNTISTYKLVREIITRQTQMVQEYSKAFNLSKQDKNFTSDELDYMQHVYTGMLDESLKNIEQVQLAISSFSTQMTDYKRMEIIHAAAENMESNITDLRQFNQQNIKLSLQRSKERNDIDVVKRLYGLQ